MQTWCVIVNKKLEQLNSLILLNAPTSEVLRPNPIFFRTKNSLFKKFIQELNSFPYKKFIQKK